MSVFRNKKSEAVADETRADRVMNREGDEPTQKIDTAAGTRAGAGRGDSDIDATQPIATAHTEASRGDAEATQRIDTAGDAGRSTKASGGAGGATAVTASGTPKTQERTRSSHGETEERTRVQPIPSKGAGAGAGTAVAAGAAGAAAGASARGTGTRDTTTGRDTAARDTATRDTATRDTAARDTAVRDPEAERLAERDRRRAERDQALGTRRKAVEEPEPEPVVRPKRTTDKFLGSLGLFLLRVVTAVVIGLHGLWKVMNLSQVEQMLNNTIIPEPHIMSYVLAGAEVAIALGLLFGMLTRLAGLGLALVGIGALVFVKWVANPFNGYQLGGELELLLGAIGILFLTVGAGGWSVDAAFRRRRAASKQA